MQIRPFEISDENAVVSLWQRCGLNRAWNDPSKGIRRKLAVRPDLFLVGELDGEVIACVMAGYEGHRGWINYLVVCPEHQRRGYARAIVEEAERLLREAGCPKINLQVRSSNHSAIEFYRRLGCAVDDVVSLGKRLEPGYAEYFERRRCFARRTLPPAKDWQDHPGGCIRGSRCLRLTVRLPGRPARECP